jgi:hypothetical protein
VRERHAAGETAAGIAEGLGLDLVAVERFLFPPASPPRPVRPARPSRHWPGWHDDAPELAAVEPIKPAIAAAEVLAEPLEAVPEARAPAGPWGPYQERPGRRPVLTDVEAQEVRELAREGWTRPELAARFGVSKTTIDSAVRGTLRTRPAPPDEPEPDPSPATPGPAWRDD